MRWRRDTVSDGRLFRMCPCGHAAGLHRPYNAHCSGQDCVCTTSPREVMRHGVDPTQPTPWSPRPQDSV